LTTSRFPAGVSKFATGISRVKKDEFAKAFDYGIPIDKGSGGDSDVLILYNTASSIPSDKEIHHYVTTETGESIPSLDLKEATENCEALNVINTGNPGNLKQCLAIIQGYESYHVQRWMRQDPKTSKVNLNADLVPTSRGVTDKGLYNFVAPSDSDTKQHFKMLKTYLETLDDVTSELEPILKSVASKENNVIIMTCNFGQSELLINFMCNAKNKNLDTSNILLFPTDEDTHKLAESLGLKSYLDKRNFDALPSGEARRYGDPNFVRMMYAKVVCVQLTNMLGYNVLFQDVDIVWYRNPLEYFLDQNNPYPDFDMYFQEDGAHSVRYAPLSANSGFYYVKSSKKTRHMLKSLLFEGDVIIQCHSHQQAFIQIMNEHASLYNLRVKVLQRDAEEFPGGYHYHRRKNFMKEILQKKTLPYLFHMSWTANKDNKIKYFQQMGEWFVHDQCIGQTYENIINNISELTNPSAYIDKSMPIQQCCLAEPNVICHYKDKPSLHPCKESPPIDKHGRSFW